MVNWVTVMCVILYLAAVSFGVVVLAFLWKFRDCELHPWVRQFGLVYFSILVLLSSLSLVYFVAGQTADTEKIRWESVGVSGLLWNLPAFMVTLYLLRAGGKNIRTHPAVYLSGFLAAVHYVAMAAPAQLIDTRRIDSNRLLNRGPLNRMIVLLFALRLLGNGVEFGLGLLHQVGHVLSGVEGVAQHATPDIWAKAG